jgi:hypothetical protein
MHAPSIDAGSPRAKNCQELLPLLERMEANKFRNIVAGDESWFTLEYQYLTN